MRPEKNCKLIAKGALEPPDTFQMKVKSLFFPPLPPHDVVFEVAALSMS